MSSILKTFDIEPYQATAIPTDAQFISVTAEVWDNTTKYAVVCLTTEDSPTTMYDLTTVSMLDIQHNCCNHIGDDWVYIGEFKFYRHTGRPDMTIDSMQYAFLKPAQEQD